MSTTPTVESGFDTEPSIMIGRPRVATLNSLLADLICLQLLAKHAHWNVVGPSFSGLHQRFDEIALVAREASENVAERIRALGAYPDGRVSAIATTVLMDLDAGPIRDTESAGEVEAILCQIANRLADALSACEGDAVTQDVITTCLGQVEQNAWLIRAHDLVGQGEP